MASPENTATSTTLLLRLRDAADHEAWEAFVTRYAPQVFAWCRRYALQESDAADVTQEVLLKLVRAMRSFSYEPSRGSFRGWLKTVTANAVRDLAGGRERDRGVGGTKSLEQLAALGDPRSLDELAAAVEAQYERELLREAEQRVRPRVQPHTWEAYRLTAVENVAAAQAAAQLSMPVAEVYVAKSRVIKLLREEVRRLEESS